ncbi:unnamed protein product [Cuscuta epithymum]|uniref:DUF659 domain-containing protein n=1 Tax=Cuscuta epithymum TaxID=186058 RepID=A0AAV0EGP7_9ASTE|nr:unnamed protein product [Cuscuta epithymum]
MKKASLNMEKHPKLVQSHGSDNYESGDIDANKCIRKQKGPRQEEGPIYAGSSYAKKLKKPKQAKSEEEFFIHESCKKESRDKVCEAISQWVCDASIPFDAVNYASFRTMMDSMGRCGVSIKPPSYREMWGPLLSKEANDMLDLIDSPEEDWARYGCSLRVDERTYQDERTIVNFLVSSPKGTHFLQSVDASDLSKYGEAMFHLIDFFIERIGETKVIQVVTDDATSNVLAGKLLEEKRSHLCWSPCVGHSINLMLKDIVKLSEFVRTLKRAMRLNAYVYYHPFLTNLLKCHCGKTTLVRGGVTIFATIYLTLWHIHKLKNKLRQMFLSDDWRNSKWKKERVGKKLARTVWFHWFWNNVVYMLRIFRPLVRVLRLVSSDKKPAMGVYL